MARKLETKQLRVPMPVGIGAGLTEKCYLKHLRTLKGYKLDFEASLLRIGQCVRHEQTRYGRAGRRGESHLCL